MIILITFISLLTVSSYAGTSEQFSVPIRRKQLSKPVTPLQKLLSEARMARKKEIEPPSEEKETELGFVINLDNMSNQLYTGPVYFGTPLQVPTSSEFIYDTSSGYLVVTGKHCTNCHSTYYDADASTSAEPGIPGYTDKEDLTIDGTVDLEGKFYTDNVCLDTEDETTCAEAFGFFRAKSQEGMDDVDGILGLAPYTGSAGPPFVSYLYYTHLIESPVFSFHLNYFNATLTTDNTNGQVQLTANEANPPSVVTFGGLDSTAYAGRLTSLARAAGPNIGSKFYNYWTVSNKGTSYGGFDIGHNVDYAIMDTGTNFLVLPEQQYKTLMEWWQAIPGMICLHGSCTSPLACVALWPNMNDVTMKLGDYQYTLTPEGVTIDVVPSGLSATRCIIAVSSIADSYNMAILGETFLRSFYSSYNQRTNSVKLAVNANAPHGTNIENAALLSDMAVTILIFAGIAAFMLSCCLGVWCIGKYKKWKNRHIDQQYAWHQKQTMLPETQFQTKFVNNTEGSYSRTQSEVSL